MKVFVTGGSGGLGRWVVRELEEHGHSTVNADRRAPEKEGERARHVDVDLTSAESVQGVLAGCEAVVHLAAIPAPGGQPSEVVFGNNVLSTFAVLQAASEAGIKRAVVASSTAALGAAFSPKPFGPLYVPIDEEHPLLPYDPYALSKEVGERISAAFGRRGGMCVLALRFHYVAQPGEAARRAATFDPFSEGAARELGGYVDVRDAAYACRLGVERRLEGPGFDVFNILAADSLSSVPTLELVRRHYPGTEVRGALEGTASAWSTEKARRVLGYVPRYSWRGRALEEAS